jgi:hypothetical protein
VLSSIIGQNERWAQLAAYHTPPAAQSGQTSGATPGYPSSFPWAGSGDGAVTGGTSSPIADGTNFALMAFGSTSPAGGTADASDGASIATTGTSAMSRVLTDLQSLLSTLGGRPPAAGSSGAPAADTDSASISNTGTTAGNLSQDLRQLSTDLGSLASTLQTHRGDHDRGEPPPGPPPGSSDILNTGTASAGSGGTITNSGSASASGGRATFMQQFAAGAYGSGYDGSTTSSLLAINA